MVGAVVARLLLVLAPVVGLQPAVRETPLPPVATTVQATPARVPWRYCEQWHDLAAEVGWPESDGPVLSYVMHRESRCNPGAYNRSGAAGLMQLLGWSCSGGCTNPRGNLVKALQLRQQQGWCPWVLRGDPVTGRACG